MKIDEQFAMKIISPEIVVHLIDEKMTFMQIARLKINNAIDEMMDFLIIWAALFLIAVSARL